MLSYELPKELIARQPCEPRDAARLLVVERSGSRLSHRTFRDLPDLLRPGDCLVLNDTKVLPARLIGTRADTGGKVEMLLLERLLRPMGPRNDGGGVVYRCLGQPGKRLRPGNKLLFNHGSVGAEVAAMEGGERLVRFEQPLDEVTLAQIGQMPLPPYIGRPAEERDTDWYQTVFAREPGAVAAPTAGLHFTPELLERIKARGIDVAFVTLHVGWGTFKPVGEKELESGRLHPERFRLPEETLQAIREAKRRGGRVVAVGTTVVRALETQRGQPPLGVKSARSESLWSTTELFIRPPFEFRVVDALTTNFHLPGTSLLLLVEAFAGGEATRAAYGEALRERYRFYSYGDAMMIEGPGPFEGQRCQV